VGFDGLEMINFLDFSMKLLWKIRGKSSFSEVLDLFLYRCRGRGGESFTRDY
jgi:hypothetical protein